jgi:hypothetical protein
MRPLRERRAAEGDRKDTNHKTKKIETAEEQKKEGHSSIFGVSCPGCRNASSLKRP